MQKQNISEDIRWDIHPVVTLNPIFTNDNKFMCRIFDLKNIFTNDNKFMCRIFDLKNTR